MHNGVVDHDEKGKPPRYWVAFLLMVVVTGVGWELADRVHSAFTLLVIGASFFAGTMAEAWADYAEARRP